MNKATEALQEIEEANSFDPTIHRAMEYSDKHKTTYFREKTEDKKDE